jgi:hypothetical protein
MYLKSNRIRHQLTAPYSPAQNGQTAHLWKVRARLAHAGLPKCFWAEGVETAAYIRNRVQTRVFKDITPYEK